MKRQSLNDLAAFAVVARLRSFTAAAAELGVSSSALSHKLRGLEARAGVRLLARSTRSVAPTEAGRALLCELEPALARIEDGLEALSAWRDTPSGMVKITTFHWIAARLLVERLPVFLASHPDITVEVTAEDGLTDIVSAGFDAGIRLGEAVEKDMIGVRVGPPLRTLVTATPTYWQTHGYPTHPNDLRRHRCINYRQSSSGALLPWDFEKDGHELRIRCQGQLICNSWELALATTRQGIGVGWHMAQDVEADLAEGRLEQALDDWSPAYPGAVLYHSSRRQTPAPLRALIDFLKV